MLPSSNITSVVRIRTQFRSAAISIKESYRMSPTRFRARRTRTGLYARATLAAPLLLLAACQAKPPAPQTPQVTVAPVVEREIADWDEFTGRFEAVNAVEVRPRIAGFVQRVAFV